MKIIIKVQPNSSRQEIQTDIEGNIQKVFLKKPAIDSKANKELEKLLTKKLGAKATITKGFTTKTKTVEIEK